MEIEKKTCNYSFFSFLSCKISFSYNLSWLTYLYIWIFEYSDKFTLLVNLYIYVCTVFSPLCCDPRCYVFFSSAHLNVYYDMHFGVFYVFSWRNEVSSFLFRDKLKEWYYRKSCREERIESFNYFTAHSIHSHSIAYSIHDSFNNTLLTHLLILPFSVLPIWPLSHSPLNSFHSIDSNTHSSNL